MPFNYDIENSLEKALAILLTNAGLPAYTSQGIDDLATPRIDVHFQLGVERPVITTSGTSNTWDGQFVISVITDRDRNGTQHAAYRASVRQILAETTGSGWSAALGPSFLLLDCSHVSTAYNILDQSKALDASVMTYTVVLRLLEG